MSTRVLIVERPGDFRDSLLREVNLRGATAHVRDDAMEALASIERLSPQIVVVSDDPGPPGALGLCRLLQRKLADAAVYRLGEPSHADQLDERSLLLPRAVGASALASAIFDKSPVAGSFVAHRAWEGSVASLELGPLLLAIETRWLTGRLLITRPGTEREIAFVRGMPIHARSSVLSERLGVIAVRNGILSEEQVDQALEHAHGRGLRLGAALLELNILTSPRLLRLLAEQLREQLTAACNAGACHARFVLDQSVVTRQPLLRMASATALLHAVAATPLEDVQRVLDELNDHALAPEIPQPLAKWLSDLRLPEANALGQQVSNVRALRARMRDADLTPPQGQAGQGGPLVHAGQPLSPDVLALALLRSGAFRMPAEVSPSQVDVRGGIRSLSPPSIVSAVVRCSQSDFTRWPVSALARARTPLEQAIDDCLHGERSHEQAHALVLLGPEADCEDRYAEVYALALSANPVLPLLSTQSEARPPTLSELRLRCHAQLKRLDTLEIEHSGVLARAHLLQTRAQVERALLMLPAPESLSLKPAAPRDPSGAPTAVATTAPAPANDTSAAATAATPPAPPPPRSSPKPPPLQASPTALEQAAIIEAPAAEPPDAALLAAAEPLLAQAHWRELRLLLATKSNDPTQLAPVFALLYAIALKEDATLSPDDASRPGTHAETIGIGVMSQLLNVPEQSPAATLIAKRMLRSRPRVFSPPAHILVLLALAVSLLGALVGFVLHSELLGLLPK